MIFCMNIYGYTSLFNASSYLQYGMFFVLDNQLNLQCNEVESLMKVWHNAMLGFVRFFEWKKKLECYLFFFAVYKVMNAQLCLFVFSM